MSPCIHPATVYEGRKSYNWWIVLLGSVVVIVFVARPEANVRSEPPLGGGVHSPVATEVPLAYGI
jgi:hypothetical protein